MFISGNLLVGSTPLVSIETVAPILGLKLNYVIVMSLPCMWTGGQILSLIGRLMEEIAVEVEQGVDGVITWNCVRGRRGTKQLKLERDVEGKRGGPCPTGTQTRIIKK